MLVVGCQVEAMIGVWLVAILDLHSGIATKAAWASPFAPCEACKAQSRQQCCAKQSGWRRKQRRIRIAEPARQTSNDRMRCASAVAGLRKPPEREECSRYGGALGLKACG